MRKTNITLLFSGLAVFILGCIQGCIEEYPIQTNQQSILDASNTLVVEADVSDMIRTQEIVLSRVADFTNDSVVSFDIEDPNTYLFPGQELKPRPVLYEEGANVRIADDTGWEVRFFEGTPGHYYSESSFGAQPQRSYQLKITLKNGQKVNSSWEQLSVASSLTAVEPRSVNDPELGEGIGFFVSAQSNTADGAYLRYSFEETFKVIAPLWNPQDFVLREYDPCADPVAYSLELVNRDQEEQVCYRTLASQQIMLASTKSLNSGLLQDVRVHFIPKDDFKIAHRYSLLIRQHTLSLGGYLFYENLRNFSQQETVFSQIQPGAIQGNLSADNPSELFVIGYFSVSGLSESRLFLNYADYFPDAPEPPFVVPCSLRSSPESHASRCPEVPVQGGGTLCPLSIIELLDLGDIIRYAGPYQEGMVSICPGPYSYVPRVCGDCTVLGSNVAPLFWIDE